MTSRERVDRMLARLPVDRVPNGLGGCETAGMHCAAYDRLKRVLKVEDSRNRMCTFMTNAVFERSVLEAMEGDVILLGTGMCPARLWGVGTEPGWKTINIWDVDIEVPAEWSFRKDPDGTWWWGESMSPPGGYYFDSPLASSVGSDSILNEENPSPDDYNPRHEMPQELLERLASDAKWLWQNTRYAIACGEFISDLQGILGNLQSWWMRMVSDPAACHEFLGKCVDASLAQLRQLDRAVGKYCSLLMIADDMGDARGITIGPDTWREIYKPHYHRLFTEWHRITDMKVCLHSCGSMSPILADLIECGVDIYNPVQISADNMSPEDLKQKFGDKLVLYGGAYDAIKYAGETSEDAVYNAVRENIMSLGRGGGYLFAGVHNLPGNLPENHIRAMLCAYRDVREDPSLCGRADIAAGRTSYAG
jgi:uroporphyrinogen decarboxylase